MFRTLQLTFASLSLAAFICLAGCVSSEPPKPAPHDDHDEHGHEDHVHGPHDGPVAELGGEYHYEWLKDDTGLVTIYIVDEKGKKEIPVDAKELTITTTMKKSDGDVKTPYTLLAANASEGDMPKASKFELTDKNLQTALEALDPKGVTAELAITIGGKEYKTPIVKDEHHH